jgi:hypothetical protein
MGSEKRIPHHVLGQHMGTNSSLGRKGGLALAKRSYAKPRKKMDSPILDNGV